MCTCNRDLQILVSTVAQETSDGDKCPRCRVFMNVSLFICFSLEQTAKIQMRCARRQRHAVKNTSGLSWCARRPLLAGGTAAAPDFVATRPVQVDLSKKKGLTPWPCRFGRVRFCLPRRACPLLHIAVFHIGSACAKKAPPLVLRAGAAAAAFVSEFVCVVDSSYKVSGRYFGTFFTTVSHQLLEFFNSALQGTHGPGVARCNPQITTSIPHTTRPRT